MPLRPVPAIHSLECLQGHGLGDLLPGQVQLGLLAQQLQGPLLVLPGVVVLPVRGQVVQGLQAQGGGSGRQGNWATGGVTGWGVDSVRGQEGGLDA